MRMLCTTLLAGLLLACSPRGSAQAPSTQEFQIGGPLDAVRADRLDFGDLPIGSIVSALPPDAVPLGNCSVEERSIDCEFRSTEGIRYLVYGQTVTRKCVERGDIRRVSSLGLRGDEPPAEAQPRLSELTGLPFEIQDVGAEIVVGPDTNLSNAQDVQFEFFLRYSSSGDLMEACARGISG